MSEGEPPPPEGEGAGGQPYQQGDEGDHRAGRWQVGLGTGKMGLPEEGEWVPGGALVVKEHQGDTQLGQGLSWQHKSVVICIRLIFLKHFDSLYIE